MQTCGGCLIYARRSLRISLLRTALPVHQTAPRKITGAKKYDTLSAVQQRDN
jgi:hypothetical protein